MKRKILLIAIFFTCLSDLYAIRVSFYTHNKNDTEFVIDTNALTLTRIVHGYSFEYRLKDLYTMGDDIQGQFRDADLVFNGKDVIKWMLISKRGEILRPRIVFTMDEYVQSWYDFYPKDEDEFNAAYDKLYSHLQRTGKTHEKLYGNSSSRSKQPSRDQKNVTQKQTTNNRERARTNPVETKQASVSELPYRLEVPDGLRMKTDNATKGEYSGLATYEGGLVGIILHTRTGKYPEDAGLPLYDVEIKPMNGETAEWLTISNKHPNLLAINIDANYSSSSRAANLILKVEGKVQGRIFILQLAKGSQINW